MPIELARADIEFDVNGRVFTVDAFEADIALGKIDLRFSAPADAEQRWRAVAAYVCWLMRPGIVRRALRLWRPCTIRQALGFYKAVQEALPKIAEGDAKAAFPFAESPTGTDSTPAPSANGSSSPTSPTSTACTPSGS